MEKKTGKWQAVSDRILDGGQLTRDEGELLLDAPEEKLMEILAAAYRLRYEEFGNKVRLNYLNNVKSGKCEEDCHYCSQSRVSEADVEKYSLMDKKRILEGAERASENQAGTYCIVSSGREPRSGELDYFCEVVEKIKEEYDVKVCVSIGFLTEEDAGQLKEAGVDRVNHNLNTSNNHYSEICTTHSYEDRINTIHNAQKAGLSLCSGVLFGMGEDRKDAIDVVFHLREIDVGSIPVNFLNPTEGTPLEEKWDLTPEICLKLLCLCRFANPKTEIRIAGGREVHLRSLQPLGLYPANSIFVGDYLTTGGQEEHKDIRMIKDLGFEIVNDLSKLPGVD